MNGVAVVEIPQKSLVRVMYENAPIEEEWEHVQTKHNKDSSGRVEEISYILRRKKSTITRSLDAEPKFRGKTS
jgi:hypothetical protein